MATWITFWTALWIGSGTIWTRVQRWILGPGRHAQQPAEPGEGSETQTAEAGGGRPLLGLLCTGLIAGFVYGLPYTQTILVSLAGAWLVTAPVLGAADAYAQEAATDDDEDQDQEDGADDEDDVPDDAPHPSQTLSAGYVAALLQTAYTEGSGVHLATLSEYLTRDHPGTTWATRDVRALLTRTGVRHRAGVRVPPIGGREGVHRDDFPPLPPTDPEPPVVADVAAGQSNNNNGNRPDVQRHEWGLTITDPSDTHRRYDARKTATS
ncbi:hypothetical protein [Streptomyces liangshanensis]|uniref:hypothetical protein n=1 Tax=Streptomyces liangshanensis TaxID=2717324 RepID=UPI0036DE9470